MRLAKTPSAACMMIMNRLLLLFSTLFALTGCHHPDEPMPPMPKIYFTGISPVDEQGQALATPDPTDWRLDDVWLEQEKSLFGASSLPLCTSLPDSTLVYAAPNPCRNVFMLGLFKPPSGAAWRLRIVDENFSLLQTFDAPMGVMQVAINAANFPKDTVRVYYQVEKLGCVWRGHGDVLVEN